MKDQEWEKEFGGKFNDKAYLEMPTVGGFTTCVQQNNGMPASVKDIKSFIRKTLSEQRSSIIKQLEEEIEETIEEVKEWPITQASVSYEAGLYKALSIIQFASHKEG